MNEDKTIEIPRRLYLELIADNEDLTLRLIRCNEAMEQFFKLPQERVDKLKDLKYVNRLRNGFHKAAELEKLVNKLEAKIYAQKKLIEELTAYG